MRSVLWAALSWSLGQLAAHPSNPGGNPKEVRPPPQKKLSLPSCKKILMMTSYLKSTTLWMGSPVWCLIWMTTMNIRTLTQKKWSWAHSSPTKQWLLMCHELEILIDKFLRSFPQFCQPLSFCKVIPNICLGTISTKTLKSLMSI